MYRQLSAITVVVAASLAPLASHAQIGISVGIAPPPIPVYAQPELPGPNYIWTPGYWAWGGQDYYWVPGTWAEAPQPGYLWTPGYWGWGGSSFVFNEGYWGPHIGFYGGIDYGFGYVGVGYRGGYWNNGVFAYNRSVNNVNPAFARNNVYNETVVNNVNVTRVSYNGGQGGVRAEPTAAEKQAAGFPHVPPTAAQAQHVAQAKANPAQYAAANHGAPAVAATPKPGVMSGAGVVHATNAPSPTVGKAEARPGAPAAAAARPGAAPAVAHPPATAVENATRATNRAVTPPAERAAARPATPAAERTTEAAEHPAAAAPRTVPHPAVAPRPAPIAHPAAPAPHPAPAPAPHPEAAAPRQEAAPRPPAAAPHPAPAEKGGGNEKRER